MSRLHFLMEGFVRCLIDNCFDYDLGAKRTIFLRPSKTL